MDRKPAGSRIIISEYFSSLTELGHEIDKKKCGSLKNSLYL